MGRRSWRDQPLAAEAGRAPFCYSRTWRTPAFIFRSSRPDTRVSGTNITRYSTAEKISGEGFASRDFCESPALSSSMIEMAEARAVSLALAT